MNHTLSRLLRAALLGAALGAPVLPALASQSSTLPPVQAFFENNQFESPKLSPDGRYLAARVGSPTSRYRLSVINLDTQELKIVGLFDNADIGRFEWVNNERLVFTSSDAVLSNSDEAGSDGVFAVNRDGTQFRQLSETMPKDAHTGSHMVQSVLDWNHGLVRAVGQPGSNLVYIRRYTVLRKKTGKTTISTLGAPYALLEVDTISGHARPVNVPALSSDWFMDGKGEPRLALVEEAGKAVMYYRDGDGEAANWRRLNESSSYTGGAFTPIGFGPDNHLYVAARQGSNTSGLYRFDPAHDSLAKEPLLALDGYDFLADLSSPDDNALVVRNNKLIGVQYLSDIHGVAWLDAAANALQEKVDQLLPGRANIITPPTYPQAPWVLVRSESDMEPATWFVYNTETQKVVRISRNLNGIQAAQMGRRTLVHYKARDGLDIPAWVTYPHGSTRKNLPMVVLVHGGPFVRGGSWGWDSDAQFLASRGYAVLEPEYRGSTGYGWQLFHAGWKQWGLSMQDDIADGVKWATAQGIVDPKRVCIAGASYGGYAVLMGLVRDPGLYRCGVEWAGVTDINLMYTGDWSAESDLSDHWKAYGMPELVGDQVKDAQQLQATSPLLQAAHIKAPLLLAYGTDDLRVPLYHGEKFYAAVKAGNPQVEWVTYEKEGHGWKQPENRYDWWSRVEKFLDKNIGESAPK